MVAVGLLVLFMVLASKRDRNRETERWKKRERIKKNIFK